MSRRLRGCSPVTAWLCVVPLTVGIVGCQPEGYRVVPVSGSITLDGEPLEGAVVVFQPVAESQSPVSGPGSHGRTDNRGRYTLRTIEPPRLGAVVGRHRVLISTAMSNGQDGSQPRGERVPERYRDGSLEFEVPPAGTAGADFSLESKRR